MIDALGHGLLVGVIVGGLWAAVADLVQKWRER